MFDVVYDLKGFVKRSDKNLLDGGLKNKTAIILSSCGWNFMYEVQLLEFLKGLFNNKILLKQREQRYAQMRSMSAFDRTMAIQE